MKTLNIKLDWNNKFGKDIYNVRIGNLAILKSFIGYQWFTMITYIKGELLFILAEFKLEEEPRDFLILTTAKTELKSILKKKNEKICKHEKDKENVKWNLARIEKVLDAQ